MKKCVSKILINSRHKDLINKNGIHYTSTDLNKIKKLDKNIINGASVHSLDELNLANKLGFDFVVLSQIKKHSVIPKEREWGGTSLEKLLIIQIFLYMRLEV